MALSADEQRALAEIERRLATDDPGLATCMTAFRRPGPGRVLRSPRARIIGSLFTVLLVAMVSLMVYALIPFRTQARTSDSPATGTSSNVSTATAGTGGPAQNSPLASASTSASATGAASSAPPSVSTGTGQANSAGSQAADQSAVGGP
jgi:cytoskeletal protein RodZ